MKALVNLSILLVIAFMSRPQVCTGVFQYTLPMLSQKVQEIGRANQGENGEFEPEMMRLGKFMRLLYDYRNMKMNTHIVGKRDDETLSLDDLDLDTKLNLLSLLISRSHSHNSRSTNSRNNLPPANKRSSNKNNRFLKSGRLYLDYFDNDDEY